MLDNMWNRWMLFAPDDSTGGGDKKDGKSDKGDKQDDEDKDKGKGDDKPSYKDWFAQQPDDVQKLVTANEAGLKSALTSERESRKDLQDEIRDLAKAAEKGSDLETKLTTIADELETATNKAEFYETAHDVGITNLKLAWLLVQSDDGLQDRKGNVNFDAMKKSNPELFAQVGPKPKGNAGEGTGSDSPGGDDMNVKIRKAARGGL